MPDSAASSARCDASSLYATCTEVVVAAKNPTASEENSTRYSIAMIDAAPRRTLNLARIGSLLESEALPHFNNIYPDLRLTCPRCQTGKDGTSPRTRPVRHRPINEAPRRNSPRRAARTADHEAGRITMSRDEAPPVPNLWLGGLVAPVRRGGRAVRGNPCNGNRLKPRLFTLRADPAAGAS